MDRQDTVDFLRAEGAVETQITIFIVFDEAVYVDRVHAGCEKDISFVLLAVVCAGNWVVFFARCEVNYLISLLFLLVAE